MSFKVHEERYLPQFAETIQMRIFYSTLLLNLICSAIYAAPPNVILIMADDLGYECVTANGGESYQTPVLDKLAAGGMRFEHAHSQPLCTPTRVQLMTGRYNVRNYLNFGTLPRTETTFGNLFQKAGYATGVCGKWQLGRETDSPQHFGFAESLLWQQTHRPPRYANPGLELNGVEQEYPEGSYGPTLVNDWALDFITRHKAQPFFLYYPMILTHNPFQPTPDSPDWDPKAMGEKVLQADRHFGEMIMYMDKLIGRVDAKLGELGIRDNTLVIFLGDNGTNRGITSRFKGRDYKGGKGTTAASGHHVPLIVSWPSVIKQPTVNKDLISCADLLPTICQVAGIAVPEQSDGMSFLPQLRGERGTPRESIYMWYSPRQTQNLTVSESAFDQHYKLYRTGEFYDLQADPLEKSKLDVNKLMAVQTQAKTKLAAVLDQYKGARPIALDDEFKKRGPESDDEEAKPKAKKGSPKPAKSS
jgi:arylsulfatase A